METTAVPEDAVALSVDGYYVEAKSRYNGEVEFHLHGNARVIQVCRVNLPFQNQFRREDYSRPADGALIHPSINVSSLYPRQMRMVVEIFTIAADYAAALNSCYMDELRAHQDVYERLRDEKINAEQQEKQQKEELYEHVRWLIGDQIRLKRAGYRSTVFGTIDRVSEPGQAGTSWRRQPAMMYITTERGKYMRINLDDVTVLDHKEPGAKRFTNIYTRGDAHASVV